MRISQYDKVIDVNDDDLILIETAEGTRTIKASDLKKIDFNSFTKDIYVDTGDLVLLQRNRSGSEDKGQYKLEVRDLYYFICDQHEILHKSTVKYGSLGTGAKALNILYNGIRLGTFNELWLGQSLTINNHMYIIVDFNYFNTTRTGTKHVVLMPYTAIGVADGMYPTDTTAEGYLGSQIRNLLVNGTFLERIYEDFGEEYIYLHKDYGSNAVTDGVVTGMTSISDSVAELPTEMMLFGVSSTNNGNYTQGYRRQLSLFRYSPPDIMNSFSKEWLRDIYDDTDFLVLSTQNYVTHKPASTNKLMSVRPIFAVYVPEGK